MRPVRTDGCEIGPIQKCIRRLCMHQQDRHKEHGGKNTKPRETAIKHGFDSHMCHRTLKGDQDTVILKKEEEIKMVLKRVCTSLFFVNEFPNYALTSTLNTY